MEYVVIAFFICLTVLILGILIPIYTENNCLHKEHCNGKRRQAEYHIHTV